EARSNFHPRTVSLSLATNWCGLKRGPEGNSRSSRDDINSFMYVPPTSTTRTLLFIAPTRWGGTSDHVGPIDQNVERCPAVLVLPPCSLASIPLFQERQTERASVSQISNLALNSLRFAVPNGCH